MTTRRTRGRAGVAVAALIAFFLFANAALAVEIRQFEASIFPNVPQEQQDPTDPVYDTGRICDGAVAQPLTFTYRNSADSTHPTGSIAYLVPDSLVVQSVTPVDAGSNVWTISRSGNTLTLAAVGPADKLDAGEAATIRLTVTAQTPADVTIGVEASQSSDPGSGNQFTGNALHVKVVHCTDVHVKACDGGLTSATTRSSSAQSTATTDCDDGSLVIGTVSTGTLCEGRPQLVEVLVNPPNPGVATKVVTLVAKSLVGGNIGSLVVCKDGAPYPALVESVPGGVLRVTVTFPDGTDPIKGIG